MFKKLVILCLLVSAALAQDVGTPVNPTAGPPFLGFQTLYYYTGSNVQYVCYAASDQLKETAITVSAASNANPVSFTATAHGFDFQTVSTVLPAIKITGGTGNWTGVNGVWVATPTSANAFTIPVDSTGFGALTGTLVVTTRAPLTTQNVWAIKFFVYNASNAVIGLFWAGNPAGAGSTALTAGGVAMNKACASRTTYAYQ